LRRLVNGGFLEEADGSTPKRKMYQVTERFYNIYYLMRFSRSGKRRLVWLIHAMRALYSANDFNAWSEKTLNSWKSSTDPRVKAEHEAFLYSLNRASDCVGLQSDLVEKTIAAAWETDQFECLNRLLDQELGHQALGGTFDLISFFAKLPSAQRKELGYKPKDAKWWLRLGAVLDDRQIRQAHYRNPVEDPIGMGAYTLDSHNTQCFVHKGMVKNEGDIQSYIGGKAYGIAYRAIVPPADECENLLVPWALSTTHIEFGSIRMEPVFMILGQSAATAACIAIDHDCSIQTVPYDQLRKRLIADDQKLDAPL